ncbi:hypothetical protein LCGC14_0997810 [marine sediment metagenome]|uniref:Uncharacterized protein n=1 Tax=marine sediment metagenome TaxID=412755 RepID=A0A0F9N3Y8_9ZZZZ
MPSLVQTMAASPTVFAVEKRNAKIIPSHLMVDNVLGAQDAVLSIQDRFTPAVSNAVAIPVVTTVSRLSINVSMNACVSIRDELKDLKVLGQLEIVIGTPDAACIVSVGWNFD